MLSSSLCDWLVSLCRKVSRLTCGIKSQNPPPFWGFVFGRGPSPGAICCCFPEPYKGLDQNWSNWDSKQLPSGTGLYPLCCITKCDNIPFCCETFKTFSSVFGALVSFWTLKWTYHFFFLLVPSCDELQVIGFLMLIPPALINSDWWFNFSGECWMY